MPLTTPFDNAVLPNQDPNSDHADTLGGFSVGGGVGAGSGSLNSPFDNAVAPMGVRDSDTPNSVSGLPSYPTTIGVEGAPKAGSTIALPDMTTTPNPKL